MLIRDFQKLMAETYGDAGVRRGVPATIAWLTEELGELARAVRKGSTNDQVDELGDVLAWLASLANQLGIDLQSAAERFAAGCPKCGHVPSTCPVGRPSNDAASHPTEIGCDLR